MVNPLDQFRRNPQVSNDPTNNAQANMKKPYLAFEARTGKEAARLSPEDSLEIRQLTEPWQAPEWRYIQNMIYNGEYAEKIVMVYGSWTVKIEGEHLQHLITALRKKTCIFIQDYDPREYQEPEPSQCVIRSITIKPRKDEQEIIDEMPANRVKELA